MSEKITDESLNDFNRRHDFWDAYLTEWVKTPPRPNLVELYNRFSAITALMMLEKGESRASIRKTLSWNSTTLRNFEARHTLTIQENRKVFSRQFAMNVSMGMDVINMKLEQLLEDESELKKTDIKSIAVAVGILTDKGAQMDGMASQIVEHRNTDASVGDAFEFIKAAKERAANKHVTLEAEIVP